MTRATHKTTGMVITTLIGMYLHAPLIVGIEYIIVSWFASTFADIDLKLEIKHRLVTHNLLFCLVLSGSIGYFNKGIGLIVFVNYILHLVLDTCTVMGIPWLYPFSNKYYSFKLCRCGDKIDYGINVINICILLIMVNEWL